MKNLLTSLFCSQKRVSWRRLAVLALGTYLGLAYIAGDSAEKAMAALSKK